MHDVIQHLLFRHKDWRDEERWKDNETTRMHACRHTHSGPLWGLWIIHPWLEIWKVLQLLCNHHEGCGVIDLRQAIDPAMRHLTDPTLSSTEDKSIHSVISQSTTQLYLHPSSSDARLAKRWGKLLLPWREELILLANCLFWGIYPPSVLAILGMRRLMWNHCGGRELLQPVAL